MGFSSHTESRLWLVAGLLLPIWNRLPGENMRVRRLATDAGESLLGRVLTPEQAHAFRDAFGLADGPVMSPTEMHEAILIRGASSHEGSGGTLRRVAERHHGRQRRGHLTTRAALAAHNRANGLSRPTERVVAFYNQRGTAEQWIKEGKNAIKWTRLSCRKFRHNAVRLQLHALAYNLGNFMRTLALPDAVEQWSLTTLREKLVKIGARIVRHGRYIVFQMAEVAIPRDLFADILRRIDRLRPNPSPA